MSRSRFACDTPTRRALMVGVGLGAPMLALMATHRRSFDRAAALKGVFRVGDLVGDDGQPSEMARAKAGQSIVARGYRAPAMREGAAFDLYECSTAPCLSCGLIHDPGASVTVVGETATIDLSVLSPVEIAGRVEIDARGALRLVAA
jgi:hypothetical protein